MNIKLDRPLIFFDLETTGTDILHDRIVEISAVKLMPDGEIVKKTRRINPCVPIPAAATAVHHITDEMVADEPTFKQVSKSLAEFFENSDIAGFNSNKFDVPLLIEEFGRAGVPFDVAARKFIDVQGIFHKKEQRTLVAAYKFYCDKDLLDAHSAEGDAMATLEVLMGQIDRYPDIGDDVASLAEFSGGGRNLDLMARIVLNDAGVPVFNFGKHRGKPVKDVLTVEPSFYNWVMNSDFSKNTKDVLTQLKYKYSKES